MRLPSRLLVVLALLAVPSSAVAQTGAARDRQQPAAVQRGTESIVGHVVAADTSRPLRLVRVTATAPEVGDGRVAMTDENGAFEFPGLLAGHYTVSASKAGFILVNFGQRRPLRAGRPIQVRDGQRVRDIDFRLPRGSVITGRVIDQEGEPLVRATVRALRYRYVQGERRIEPGGGAETDDRGVFRIYGLTPGTYFVSAMAQPSDFRTTAEFTADASGQGGLGRVTVIGTDSPVPLTYAPTYYPGVASLTDAAPITVPISEEVAGIDFTLQLVTAARITGLVLNGSGTPADSTMVQLLPDDSRGMAGQTYSAFVDRGGRFSIPNVPPGRYVAIAFSGGGGRGRGGGGGGSGGFAIVPLSVSGPLVSDVNLVLAPGLMISGQVTFEGTATPSAQDWSRVRIALWTPASASLPGFLGQGNATVRADGSFSIPNLPPGSRMVRVSGLPQGWALKGIYLDGREVTDEMIDFKPSEPAGRVAIIVSDKATTLTGTAVDEQGQPLSDYTVIALPADSNLWRPMSRFIQAGRPDKDGTYTIRGLPPGEYLLRAIDDVEQGEWYDPELLQQLRAGATRVILQDGDTKSQDLKIAASSE